MGLVPRKTAGLALALVVGALTGVLLGTLGPEGAAGQATKLLETLTVPNNNSRAVSSVVLQAGEDYTLKFQGTVQAVPQQLPSRTEHWDSFFCYGHTGPSFGGFQEECMESPPGPNAQANVRFWQGDASSPYNSELSYLMGGAPTDYHSDHVYVRSGVPTKSDRLVVDFASGNAYSKTGTITVEIYGEQSTSTTPTTPTETTPGTTTPGTDPGTGGGGDNPWDGSDPRVVQTRVGGAIIVRSPPLASCRSVTTLTTCVGAVAAVEGEGGIVVSEGSSRPQPPPKDFDPADLVIACFSLQARLEDYVNRRRREGETGELPRTFRRWLSDPVQACAEWVAEKLKKCDLPQAFCPSSAAANSSCGTRFQLRAQRKGGKKRRPRRYVLKRSSRRLRGGVRYQCVTNDQGGALIAVTGGKGGLRRQLGRRWDLAIVTPRGARSKQVKLTFFGS